MHSLIDDDTREVITDVNESPPRKRQRQAATNNDFKTKMISSVLTTAPSVVLTNIHSYKEDNSSTMNESNKHTQLKTDTLTQDKENSQDMENVKITNMVAPCNRPSNSCTGSTKSNQKEKNLYTYNREVRNGFNSEF